VAQTNPSLRFQQPGQLTTYILKADDNLVDLALELGRDVEVMACVTSSANIPLSELRPGQVIQVPEPGTLCHTVQPDETLPVIAETYQVEVSVVVETAWNELEGPDQVLEPGQRLQIPGGVRPASAPGSRLGAPSAYPENSAESASEGPQQGPNDPFSGANDTLSGIEDAAQGEPTPESSPQEPGEPPPEPEPWPYGDGHFIWPAQGPLSQGFSSNHKAIDIAVPYGTPVMAADNGVVIKSGYSTTGYGGRIVIDHNNDYLTLYGHLAQALVEEGDVVEKGQIIGLVGSTGYSSGPHLHLELRDFGYLIDPRTLLE
jgi:murein DD-endopeptidase MepM/ murein hydrolase activator NlpD